MRRAAGIAVALLLLTIVPMSGLVQSKEKPKSPPKTDKPAELIDQSVKLLIAAQDASGEWSYEGVYRVRKEIPVGYRIGGTSSVGTTLLIAAPKNAEANAAVARGLALVLKDLNDPEMAPSTDNKYDVRVWGHGCALEFLCQVRAAKATDKRAKDVDEWITKLIATLVTEEIPGGGWNYANHKSHASFVTAPIVQALLLAQRQGEKVPAEVLERARKALETSRTKEGAFLYSGVLTNNEKAAKSKINLLPGSIARSAVCETTLQMLGAGSTDAIRESVEAFNKHWEELEKRRQKTGTHVGDYLIAPYFFYYGHRYCAQAIEMLPKEERQAQRDKLLKFILKTRDEDGTWNDRVFARSRNYCSAMVVLALLGEQAPMPHGKK